ncbi:hypothetical protein, unlikely [Trypanosoma brucei brucei TREU927]|uniref:Secreted protein n=1 Tax=Trypanosoma brucei brucei (strain 927/4 GUTat10.1) TaxID=185431 RepID=Q4GZ94_TRYB2|nr:hypothetical protein, unlikely [Trypanosoma brucei brucei TREU927]CAJ16072.1 hypothetical protein, unlikely [Trypanosoma brucei brucei TREU927]
MKTSLVYICVCMCVCVTSDTLRIHARNEVSGGEQINRDGHDFLLNVNINRLIQFVRPMKKEKKKEKKRKKKKEKRKKHFRCHSRAIGLVEVVEELRYGMCCSL